MSEMTCPACGGGFPMDMLRNDVACPWCEWMLAGPDQSPDEVERIRNTGGPNS